MNRAIELAPDRATAAELYADLAFESALRAGMWRRRPARELVDGWIDRALELAEPESRARARALIARCDWAPLGSAEAGREASALAERLGDPDLRSYAWDARAITLWVSGEHDLGRAMEERRFELLDQIHDPDHIADIHYAPVTGCIWLGYFDEARRLARRHDEITSVLTPHHRIHGVAVSGRGGGARSEAGRRSRRSSRAPRRRSSATSRRPASAARARCSSARSRPASSETTPAPHSSRRVAEEFRMEGYGHVLDTPRLRLALVRDDLDLVEQIWPPTRCRTAAGTAPGSCSRRMAARLDALARIGHRDELEAWKAPRAGTYLEPFYLRALGLVREDEQLLERSLAAFEALRLETHAAETRAVLA